MSEGITQDNTPHVRRQILHKEKLIDRNCMLGVTVNSCIAKKLRIHYLSCTH